MAICRYCGKEFDPSYAKSVIDGRFGDGLYEEYCDGDVCDDCAYSEVGAAVATGEELLDYMGGRMGPD